MNTQYRRVKIKGTPKAVWLLPREDGELDKYELWSSGAITVSKNVPHRTMQYLVKPPQ